MTMKDLKEFATELTDGIKANPIEAIKSAVVIAGLFGLYYIAIWICCSS